MIRHVGRLPVLVALGSLLVACGPVPTSTSPAATAAPPAVLGSPSSTPSPSPGPRSGATVAVDTSLLDILPASVDGLAMTEASEQEAAALDDPVLARVGSAIAAGLAIDPASGEFVYAVVVRLIPGAMTDAGFRDWRDSFDLGACSQAGGVTGHAEAEIANRTVYIGTCAGGLRTYHVRLEARGIVVSASAVGQRRLGERLVENLRP